MIPIKDAEFLAIKTGQKQIIIFGWDGASTHVATYGVTTHDCDVAARGANLIKKNWEWPDDLMAEPSRIEELRDIIKSLQAEIKKLKST